MDPNNQNNQGGVGVNPGTVQPTQQPVQPAAEWTNQGQVVSEAAQVQIVSEPMAQAQMTPGQVSQTQAAPVQAVQTQTTVEQMVQAQANPEQPAKKKMSGGMLGLIIGLAVFLIGGGIFAALMLTGVINFGGAGGGGLFSNPTPTPELAKSVCEKYGGKYAGSEVPYGDYAAIVDCDNSDADKEVFAYEMIFVMDEKTEEYWKKGKDSIVQGMQATDTDVKILENSDSFIKLYKTEQTGMTTSHSFEIMYKNATIELQVLDGNFGEQLLVELGFPDRSKGGPYAQADENSHLQWQLEQYNAEHRNNMAMLMTSLVQYQANNRGQLPKISNNTLVGFDSYLGDDFKDPKTENKYTIVAYSSLADSPYATDQSGLGSAPSDEAYVFYNASCENGVVVVSNRERSFVVVHSSETDDDIYCIES